VSKDSLEKRLKEIEALTGKTEKKPLTVFSEVPGQYYILEGMAKVPVKELEQLKESAVVTLVVLRACEQDAEQTGLSVISVVSQNAMMLTARVLAGERTERKATDEDTEST